MKHLLGAVVVVVVVASLAACGTPERIDARGARIIDAQIVAARQAAAQGDVPRAMTLLRAVEDSVNSLRTRRWVSDRRAAGILAAVGDAQDALRRYAERTDGNTPDRR